MATETIEKQQIESLVFAALDTVNARLASERQVPKRLDTLLYGDEGQLDSLGIIDLIAVLEQSVHDEFGITVTLATEEALSQDASPLRSVATLVDHLYWLLGRQSG